MFLGQVRELREDFRQPGVRSFGVYTGESFMEMYSSLGSGLYRLSVLKAVYDFIDLPDRPKLVEHGLFIDSCLSLGSYPDINE